MSASAIVPDGLRAAARKGGKMTRGELQKNPNYSKVQVSRARGYVSRVAAVNDLPAVPYNGKYGEGYTVMTPAYDSSQYCFKEYYIRNSAAYMGGDPENATIEECMGDPAQEDCVEYDVNPFSDWLTNPERRGESDGSMLARCYAK